MTHSSATPPIQPDSLPQPSALSNPPNTQTAGNSGNEPKATNPNPSDDTSQSAPPEPNPANPSTESPSNEAPDIDPAMQVRLKGEEGNILLILPPESKADAAAAFTWNDLWQQLKQRLQAGQRFWKPNTIVHLVAGDRLLDLRQLQAIADALAEVKLVLKRVFTTRRQTAVAAATAGYSVEQESHAALLSQTQKDGSQALAEPLYIQTTLRSGAEIRHNGSVIIFGDLNPGSSIVAEGDILVWGRLRGTAHAGSKGNPHSVIMALQMEPPLLRIATFVARTPEKPPTQYQPEVAYVASGGIRITRAIDFYREKMQQA